MKKIHGILKFTNLESSTFKKGFSKRENLKQSYIQQISNITRENYLHLKNGNVQLSKNQPLTSEFKSQIFKVIYLTKSHVFKDYELLSQKRKYVYTYKATSLIQLSKNESLTSEFKFHIFKVS